MKVVHISTHDLAGGAARAAYRLHTGLLALAQDSSMLVLHKDGDDERVRRFEPSRQLAKRVIRSARRLSLWRTAKRSIWSRPSGTAFFTDDRTEYGSSPIRQVPKCDVLHLHWISGFVDYGAFFKMAARLHSPLVWTLHDMNSFTGGCHYDNGCGKFALRCGACPELGSREPQDLSAHVWERKHQAYNRLSRLHLVTPSRWLAQEVERSALMKGFGVSVIPYGLDVNDFAPRDRRLARQILGLPEQSKVILFAAASVAEPRKGFSMLLQALAGLGSIPGLHLLSVGPGANAFETTIPHVALGSISNDRLLSWVYSAADVYVLPTLQDNLPNTVMEALACGTPVAGFDTGGVSEMVRQNVTGLVVPTGDIKGLREAIIGLLNDSALRARMAENCRRIAVEEYTLEAQARSYVRLYENILSNN